MIMDEEIIKLVKKHLNGEEVFSTGANNYNLWLDMYRDESPWLGTEVYSLGLPSSIASELAKLTTLEMKSEIPSDDELNGFYQLVIQRARSFVEHGLALGGIILKPCFWGDSITTDYITPDLFIPISFDNSGDIDHIVFIDEIKRDELFYRRIEEHDLTGSDYVINNSCFISRARSELGQEAPLDSVSKWADVVETATLKNVKKPLFAHFKNPQANNLDLSSPLGVSCYSRATSLIQDADEQYSRILWEYEGSELAVDADITALENGNKLPAGKERLFRNLGLDQPEGFYKVFNPQIRDVSLFNGLNKILMRIEFLCGLAYGTLSDVQQVEKTAEEIKASKQRSYATVVDIQKNLKDALTDYMDAVITLRKLYLKKPITSPEIAFEFDDSLIVDSKTEQAIRLQEVSAGILKPEAYLMWRYGVNVEQARAMMPGVDEESEYDEVE